VDGLGVHKGAKADDDTPSRKTAAAGVNLTIIVSGSVEGRGVMGDGRKVGGRVAPFFVGFCLFWWLHDWVPARPLSL